MLSNVRHDLARLASRVRQRRLELGLTQRDASIAAGVSDQTWVNVERGDKVSDRTLAGVERALGWQAGAAAGVAAGGEPAVTAGPDRTVEERLAVIEAELAELRDLVENSIVRHDPEHLEQLSQREGRRPADAAGRQRAG